MAGCFILWPGIPTGLSG